MAAISIVLAAAVGIVWVGCSFDFSQTDWEQVRLNQEADEVHWTWAQAALREANGRIAQQQARLERLRQAPQVDRRQLALVEGRAARLQQTSDRLVRQLRMSLGL